MAQGKKGAIEQDKTINIRMGGELYEDVQKMCEETNISFSGLVRELLEERVDAYNSITEEDKALIKRFRHDRVLRSSIKEFVSKNNF